MSVRVRFAPSPTGHLHIGNIRTALFNFLFARHHGGKLILRIEDTDPERSKQEFADSLMRDLETLGLRWDEGPFYQSKRLSFYQDQLKKLSDRGKTYLCYCTEDELAARRKEAMLLKRPPRYDNRCRNLTTDDIQKREAQGIRPSIRFKVEDTNPIIVNDLIRGPVSFRPDEIGDFVIMRSHPEKKGEFLPTFHMSVCVDDGLMGVTHVIRGEDHLSNSPRHVMLFRDMGFAVPQFAHLSLIHGKAGEPLSKRLASVRVRDFVEKEGYLADALLNFLALLGWSPKDNREVLTMPEIIKEFILENSTHHPAVFNDEKLDWVNSEHLRLMTDEEFISRSKAFLHAIQYGGGLFNDERILRESVLLVRTDIKKFGDLKERLNFLQEPDASKFGPDEKAVFADSESRKAIQVFCALLPQYAAFDGEKLFEALTQAAKQSSGLKGKQLFMPLRVAVTGHMHGPELKKMFTIFSRGEIEKRLKRALTF